MGGWVGSCVSGFSSPGRNLILHLLSAFITEKVQLLNEGQPAGYLVLIFKMSFQKDRIDICVAFWYLFLIFYLLLFFKLVLLQVIRIILFIALLD